MVSHLKCIDLFVIFVHMLKSKLCTEQLILQVCNMRHYLLLLHNFDPGYHYKIMLKMRREMLKRNIIHPVLWRHHIQVKLNFAKTGVLRHATSYTECESTCVVDMCFIEFLAWVYQNSNTGNRVP